MVAFVTVHFSSMMMHDAWGGTSARHSFPKANVSL